MIREIVIAVIATLLANEAIDVSPWTARRLARWAAKHIYATDKKRQAKRTEDWEAHIAKSLPTNLSKLCFGLALGSAAVTRIVMRQASRVQPTAHKAPQLNLAVLGGSRCYAPGCTEPLVRAIDERSVLSLEAAYISALTPNGPRYNPSMNERDRREFSNLILLCPIHHLIIDQDPGRYSAEILRIGKKTGKPEKPTSITLA